MANAVKMQHGDVGTLESKLFEVETGFKVTIPYETQAKSVRINGFEEADEASNGCFAVAVSESGTPSTFMAVILRIGHSLNCTRQVLRLPSVLTLLNMAAKASMYTMCSWHCMPLAIWTVPMTAMAYTVVIPKRR